MPSLDTCINGLFEPGSIPATSGQPPTVPTPSASASLDFSQTTNSMYEVLLTW